MRDLTLSETHQSGMFSSTTHTFSLVTGEVTDVDGYGWGSYSGAWIRGASTLRLICRHMGLTQPRRLKEEVSQADLDELEEATRLERAKR